MQSLNMSIEMYRLLTVIDFLSMEKVVEMRLETSVVSDRYIGELLAIQVLF